MAHFNGNEGEFTPDSLVMGPWKARNVKLKGGQGVLKRGTVLGEISADGADKGLFVVSKKAATDGSQEPDRVLSKDTDTGTLGAEAVVFHVGTFNQKSLTLGDGHTLSTIDKPFRLRSIYLENPVG